MEATRASQQDQPMPEQTGVERTIAHAELPRLEELGRKKSALQSSLSVGPRELVHRLDALEEMLNKNGDSILEYLKREQISISAAMDLIARGINERSLDLACYFFLDNVGANLTSQALSNGMSTRGYAAEDDGSVTSIVAKLNDARTGGTLTVYPTINGVASTMSALIDGTNTTSNFARQDPGTDIFVTGDNIGAIVTTVGFGPTTADLEVTVGVRFTGRTR